MPETFLSTHEFPDLSAWKVLSRRVLMMGSPGDVRVASGQSAFVKISVLHQTRRVPVIPGTIFTLPHAFPTSFPRPSLPVTILLWCIISCAIILNLLSLSEPPS
ncbi:hypothetical protein DFH09DRAFT_1337260 [Mycena vulgaris]|nr:hypothetical protein DFH09DRAFT_1337260 [Mycena vulgaris]